ncbi:MAG: hypothetical protein Q8R91_07165 [Candidatus Omnitrophota bacterium]|nr:hypothetical protein [Candidatus Omnitrophota bacterium]
MASQNNHRLPSAVLTPLLVLAAAATWWWRSQVFRAHQTALPSEAWERVKEQYPMDGELAPPAQLSEEAIEAVVRAAPFSPTRQFVPSPVSSGQEAAQDAGPPVPPPPRFTYKGRINLGTRQRAIVEEATTRKTYFLEVGQEVAGFKVLDIDERRVVLSQLATGEELVISLEGNKGVTP